MGGARISHPDNAIPADKSHEIVPEARRNESMAEVPRVGDENPDPGRCTGGAAFGDDAVDVEGASIERI
jgi:hypothetical protein